MCCNCGAIRLPEHSDGQGWISHYKNNWVMWPIFISVALVFWRIYCSIEAQTWWFMDPLLKAKICLFPTLRDSCVPGGNLQTKYLATQIFRDRLTVLLVPQMEWWKLGWWLCKWLSQLDVNVGLVEIKDVLITEFELQNQRDQHSNEQQFICIRNSFI